MSGVPLWHDTLGFEPPQREPLAVDRADVAIVGAGYSGLWTAYYLAVLDPSLDIVVIEREHVGFGASGRNGGWCIGELASGIDALTKAGGADAALRLVREGFAAVDEVERVCTEEGINCDFSKGGTIRLARNEAQMERARAEVDHHHAVGLDEEDLRLLSADEARRHLAASSVLGGFFFAHTAALHPAKLVHGLAAAAERRGVRIAEGTAATKITSGVYPSVARTTTSARRGPWSVMIATEPLPESWWDSVGLADRQTFADERHLVIYGQRTADGRIAFGGRGAPYGYASRIDAAMEAGSKTHQLVDATLRGLLPQLGDALVTHRWGGVLGVPRDWFPSLQFDRRSGIGSAGGYVGEGVAPANLAGRTLAELIAGVDSPRTELPWVGHESRRWEPEPLRWGGINTALRVMSSADRAEARTGRPARRASLMWKLIKG